jgi:hypothetical protein
VTTAPTALPTRVITCPICLDRYPLSTTALFEHQPGGGYTPLAIPASTDPRRRKDLLRNSYLRCPNPSRDMPAHYLPTTYASYQEPVVIGLIGASRAGKTHLLAAMIAEIENGSLNRYRLSSAPVDLAGHAAFLRDCVYPLVDHAKRLEGTREGVTEFADALLITAPNGVWPVAFFDVAGEDLTKTGRTGRFLAGASALIFVVNPGSALGLATPDDPAGGSSLGDATFNTVLGRLTHSGRYLDIPAAVVINKSDRLRFEPPVDRWLRQESTTLSAERVTAESRDAYALLHQHGAHAWLEPVHRCARCTLHFVSATGADVQGKSFPRKVRPCRVLEPLIAIFAMVGIVDGPDAAEVGW